MFAHQTQAGRMVSHKEHNTTQLVIFLCLMIYIALTPTTVLRVLVRLEHCRQVKLVLISLVVHLTYFSICKMYKWMEGKIILMESRRTKKSRSTLGETCLIIPLHTQVLRYYLTTY